MTKPESFALLYSPVASDWKEISAVLGGLGIQVVPVTSLLEAIDVARADCFVLVLLDLDSEPRLKSAVKTLTTQAPSAALVVYSRLPEERLWLDAIEAGAFDYICKPLSKHDLAWILENARKPHAQWSMPKPVSAHVREVAARAGN